MPKTKEDVDCSIFAYAFNVNNTNLFPTTYRVSQYLQEADEIEKTFFLIKSDKNLLNLNKRLTKSKHPNKKISVNRLPGCIVDSAATTILKKTIFTNLKLTHKTRKCYFILFLLNCWCYLKSTTCCDIYIFSIYLPNGCFSEKLLLYDKNLKLHLKLEISQKKKLRFKISSH